MSRTKKPRYVFTIICFISTVEAWIAISYLFAVLPRNELGGYSLARYVSASGLFLVSLICLILGIWSIRKGAKFISILSWLFENNKWGYVISPMLTVIFFSLGVIISFIPYLSAKPVFVWMILFFGQLLVWMHLTKINWSSQNGSNILKNNNIHKKPYDFETYKYSHIAMYISIVFFIIAFGGFWYYYQFELTGPRVPFIFQDPEYQYMMSSLSVFKFQPYTFIDHPGTPIEMIGTVIYALLYPLHPNSFVITQLENPEVFLAFARGILTLLSIICAVLLTRFAIKINHWTGIFGAIGVPLLFFAVHPDGFRTLVMWSHNSFNFPLGVLLMLITYHLLQSERELKSWEVKGLGVGAGVLTAFQLYFIAWIFGIILAFAVFNLIRKQVWQKVLHDIVFIFIGGVFGFAIATYPILSQYPSFFSWVFKIFSYQGIYGYGQPGFISIPSIITNISNLWYWSPLLILVSIMLLFFLVIMLFEQRKKLSQRAGLWAVIAGFWGQLILLLTMIIKHPNSIYMLACAATLTLLFAALIELLATVSWKLTWVAPLLFGLVLFGSVLNYKNAVDHLSTLALQLQEEQSMAEKVIHDYALDNGKEPQKVVALWTYGTSTRCRALWYGNRTANFAFNKEIAEICPGQLDFDLEDKIVTNAEGMSSLDQVKWNIIFIRRMMLDDYPYLNNLGLLIDHYDKDKTSRDLLWIFNTEEKY